MKLLYRRDRGELSALTGNLTAIQGLFWFAWSFSSYANVYLQKNGFTSAQLGVLNSAASVVSIFAMAFWGIVSDRINSIRRTFLVNLLPGALLFLLIPFIPRSLRFWTPLMFCYYPLMNFFRSPTCTLLDNFTVRSCAAKGLNYGKIRSVGSFTYTVAALLASLIVTRYGSTEPSFVISGLLLLPVLLLLARAYDPKAAVRAGSGAKLGKAAAELFTEYYYVTFLVFILLFYIPFTAAESFIIYFMNDIGVSNSLYGVLLAAKAGSEVPVLLLMTELRAKFKQRHLILAACTLMSLQSLLNGLFAENLIGVLAFGVVYGLGSGVFVGIVSHYVFGLAPERLKATAHTLYVAVTSIAGIIGNSVGGFAYQLIGARPFYTAVGSAMLLAVAFLGLTFAFARGRPNPADRPF